MKASKKSSMKKAAPAAPAKKMAVPSDNDADDVSPAKGYKRGGMVKGKSK